MADVVEQPMRGTAVEPEKTIREIGVEHPVVPGMSTRLMTGELCLATQRQLSRIGSGVTV